jgi:hypothetical protein
LVKIKEKAVQFSQDGRLLAYHYKDSIFLVKTSDGSLCKRIFLGNTIENSHILKIVLVSETYLVIYDNDVSILFFINVQNNEIEHRFYFLSQLTDKMTVFQHQEGMPSTFVIKDTENSRQYNSYNLVA